MNDEPRIEQLDEEIATLRRRLAATETGEPDAGWNHRRAVIGDTLALAQQRRANLAAGLDENAEIAVPIDFDRLLQNHIAAVEAKWEARFAEFEADWSARNTKIQKGVIKAIVDVVADTLNERTDGVMRYRGCYERALGYSKGSAVTQGGSLWVAIKDAAEGEIPGMDPCWQLAVKRGAPGKDAGR